MKLSSPEGKAVSFILLMLVISAIARMLSRRDDAEVTVAPTSAGVFEQSGKPKKKTQEKKTAKLPPLGADEKIDPNTATVPELDRLPGVGPSLAAAIVKDRAASGPFLSSSDLARVRGISAERARQLSKHLNIPAGIDAPTRLESAANQTVMLNTATADDIDRIEGVSQKLALRIVHVRDSLRGFRDWRQVDAISGVGPALLARLQKRAALGR